MRAILIPADDAVPMMELDVEGDYPGLNKALAHLLADEERVWIERVVWGRHELDALAVEMWVDEEGLLKGRPMNLRAMLLSSHPMLVGDALLIGRQLGPEGEECIDLPPVFTVESIRASVERGLLFAHLMGAHDAQFSMVEAPHLTVQDLRGLHELHHHGEIVHQVGA